MRFCFQAAPCPNHFDGRITTKNLADHFSSSVEMITSFNILNPNCNMKRIFLSNLILVLLVKICAAQSPAVFRHPGIFSSQAQLDFIKSTVASNNGSPIIAGYQTLANDSKGSLSYNPEPYSVVDVVASGSSPAEDAFRRDAHAAYIHAIKWIVTGNTAYRDKSIQILNAWSYAFQSMYCTDPNKPNQTTLESSWALPIWLAGAEIIKSYSNGSAGWASADVNQFDSYVRKLLTYVNGQIASAPNWYISKGLSLMAAGVYLNDASNYNAGYNIIIPQLDAITTTGQTPELTRDFVHSQYVLIGLAQSAEVAYQQGDSGLFTRTSGASKPRLLLGTEYYTKCLMGTNTPNYQTDSQWARKSAPYEILLLRYNQLGMSVPNTQNYVLNQNRVEDGAENHFLGWLTATHSALPPTNTQTPYNGTPASIPGTIEAENFDNGGEGVAYHDNESTNQGGQYRTGEGVDIQVCTEGGYNVGWTAAGEWLEYTVNVPSTGNYNIDVRVASPNAGGTFHIEFGGVDKTGTITTSNTGGWQTWATVSKTNVSLNAGVQVMRVFLDNPNFNLNKITISSAGFSQTVQAESYSQMSGVQTETTTDTGGGQDVGYIDTNDWLKYDNITVPSTGSYLFEFRVASPNSTGILSQDLNAGAIQLGTINVPNTGGWQNWQTISRTVSINAGTYNFGIFAKAGGWNINWWRISSATGARLASSEESAISEGSDLSVFPNPVSDNLNIQLHTRWIGGKLSLSNMDSISFINESVKGTSQTFDVSHLPKGLYIVTVSKGGRFKSLKVIKQ
jgi:hypothetical protein